MQVVGMKDTLQYAMLNGKPNKDMYRDIRGAVDLCHRDGSLKTEVAANPAKYIHKVRPASDLCISAVFTSRAPVHARGSADTADATCAAVVRCERARQPRWIVQDDKLKDLLVLYRKVGRKVFLATNSLWDYTNVVMNFLIDGATGSAASLDWLQVRRARALFIQRTSLVFCCCGDLVAALPVAR